MAVIDIEPAAERVQVGLRARKLAARHGQRIGGTAHRQLLAPETLQLRIDETHIEGRVVNDHR